MKRTLAFFLAVIMILGILPMSAFAADTATLSFSHDVADVSSLKAGDTFTVTATLTNNPGFAAFQIDLDWDNSVVQFDGFSTTTIEAYGITLLDSEVIANAEAYNQTDGVIVVGKAENITTSGKMFVANFTVLKEGEANITYKKDTYLLKQTDETDVSVTVDESALDELVIPHIHNYSSVVTAPTCTAGGYTTYTCSCGYSYVGARTEATGHTFVNGVCTCGATQSVVPEGAAFTDITTADGGAVTITAQNAFMDAPYYHVEVPEGTATIKITYPAGTISTDGFGYVEALMFNVADGTQVYKSAPAYTTNEDDSVTVTVGIADYLTQLPGTGTGLTIVKSGGGFSSTFTVAYALPEGSYHVILPEGEGYTVSGDSYTSGDYSFTVNFANGYYAGASFAVKANGETLTAAADGSYTVTNVTDTLYIEVSGVRNADGVYVTMDMSEYTGGFITANAYTDVDEFTEICEDGKVTEFSFSGGYCELYIHPSAVPLGWQVNDTYYLSTDEDVEYYLANDVYLFIGDSSYALIGITWGYENMAYNIPGEWVIKPHIEHEYVDGVCACGTEDPEAGKTPYTVNIDENITGGTVTADPASAAEGDTVTLTAVPNEGYQFVSFEVKNGDETVTVTDGKFVMPEGNVTVSATFKEIPAVEGYTVTMPADISIVTGETASIPVVVDNKDGSAYNAFDMSFTYDASKLELTSTVIDGMTVTYENGTVRVQRYGSDLSVGAAAFTLTFEAIGTGETTVTATEAKVGIAENAHELDAADATILDDATVITIGGYSVNLPDDFNGESTVAPGKDYTFEAKDKNYNYDVTAKIGDTEIPVTDNGNGTFTISADQITGNIVITSTKEGKTFDVSLGDDMTGETSAQYMTPYTATLTKADGYTYDLKVKIGGADYTGFTYDEATGVVTIPGADIIGKIEFNSNKTEVQPSEYTVTFEGNGAGDAVGENKVAPGADYSFTLNKAEGYTYTVSYKMGDSTESVALTEADGKYTIEKVNGNLVITIEKESDLAVEVGAYVEMDGKTVFLVRATGTLADGKAYAYKGDTMYYSNVYQAWSWLVIVEEGNTFTADDAKANITAVEAEYTTLDQTFNVNMTSKVDVNDAQLVYNIYNCEYNDFSVATMQKFLYADTNGDKIVDTLDAAAVVNNIP